MVRFGLFELDPKARELRKSGVKVKLQDQPFRVLALLVERAGQIVSREELQQQVWPTDVYVAFDQGLNNAIRKVRDALGDSADNPRFIETVAKHGYRFVAPIVRLQETPASNRPASLARPVPRTALIGLLAVTLLSAVALWLWTRSSTRNDRVPQKSVLAVLPFDNLTHDPEQDFFSDGLTEEMIAQLGRLNPDRLAVVARGSVAKYKGTRLAANQIGSDLHANYLLEGSVRRASDRVRITVQLINVADQTDLWTESYDRELKDILDLQNSVARSVADQIKVTLTAEQRTRLTAEHKVNPEGYDAYLKGRFYWNKRTSDAMLKAAAYFQQAIEKDPGYGAAYSGLADSNSGLVWHGFVSPAEALPKAYEAALKAIEVDPGSAEAHASLALVLHHRFDWQRAEAEFRRAIQLDAQYPNAHHWYGDYLSVNGRHAEALREAKQAADLDPLNLMIGTWVGLRYYLARDYDHAIEQCRNALELDPYFGAAHLVLGQSYMQKGLLNQAMDELQKAATLSGNSPLYIAQMAVADAMGGKKSQALLILRELKETSRKRYVSPYGIAQVYAALNEKEEAFKWLHTAYDEHAVWLAYVAVDPVFDGFRSDPRFTRLLVELGLTPNHK
jgi:TolB-like protein/DNA-binding winged helix-turn-helix (wHTH) protein/Flp pilus assembly protein TadD